MDRDLRLKLENTLERWDEHMATSRARMQALETLVVFSLIESHASVGDDPRTKAQLFCHRMFMLCDKKLSDCDPEQQLVGKFLEGHINKFTKLMQLHLGKED